MKGRTTLKFEKGGVSRIATFFLSHFSVFTALTTLLSNPLTPPHLKISDAALACM